MQRRSTECTLEPASSRTCERGSKSCEVRHGDAGITEREHSVALLVYYCALADQQTIDEALLALKRAEGYWRRRETEGERAAELDASR